MSLNDSQSLNNDHISIRLLSAQMDLDLTGRSHEAETERILLEQKITDVIRRIPSSPRSALQVFEAERMEQLSRAGPVPFTPDLRQHLLTEFQNLSHAERGALQQRGVASHQARTGQAYELLRKVLPFLSPSLAAVDCWQCIDRIPKVLVLHLDPWSSSVLEIYM